jgi:hypothetical protein
MQCASSIAKSNIGLREQCGERLLFQPLRSDEQDIQTAHSNPRGSLTPLVSRLGGTEVGGPQTYFSRAPHLILHQRDQRRDDKRQPPECERRNLATHALATTGRENSHGIPAVEHGSHQLFLTRSEGRVPQVLPK